MIYNTRTFWSYICNEGPFIISRVKEMLTRKEYDFDTKKYNIRKFYQSINKIEIGGIEYESIRFPTGLISFILKNLPLQVELKESIPKLLYTEQEVLNCANLVKDINPSFEVRNYQIEACLASLNNFQSLIYSATGSGKTSVMSLVCKILEDDRILIMNGNNFILQQIYDRLLSFGMEDISWNPSKEPDYSKRIVLINTKSSDERLNKQDEAYLEFLKQVNTFIVDECQHMQALTNFEPIFYMDEINLKHIIGYSGSPFRNYDHPYNNADDFTLIAIIGEPAFSYEMKDTIGDQNVAQPYSYFINYPNKKPWLPEHLKDNYFVQYRMSITYNKARNRAGIEMLKYLNKHNVKTLVSINNIKPGQTLMKTLKEEGVNSIFICGDNTIYEWKTSKYGKLHLKTREGGTEEIQHAFDKAYNIIFGSSVLDEGVDVENFQAVVMFSAGKTPIAAAQRVGRASRKKKTGKNISFVIDFKDTGGLSIFQSHYEQRKKLMTDLGIINLPKVQDFCKMIEELNNDENTEQ